MAQWPEPRTKVRRGNYPYIFKIRRAYCVQTSWQLTEDFDAEWLAISVDGLITIKAGEDGYAWDGCSPKFDFFNIAVLGTPDGNKDHRTGRPFTYYASMVHDALYQYLDSIPVPKAEVDLLFFEMLGDFKLRHIYYAAVRGFGGVNVKQSNLSGWLGRAERALVEMDVKCMA